MKKLILYTVLGICLNASEITDLLDAVKNIPDTKIDDIAVKEMKINKKSVTDSLKPKLSLSASAEHFNTPVSLKPLTPTQSSLLIKNSSAIPFSRNVYKLGFNFSMPLFVKEINDNKKRLSFLIKASSYQAKINLLKRESLLIALISKLNYLFSLQKALKIQQQSILETIKAVKTGVETGRIAEFKLLRLQDALNKIKISLNDISTQIYDMQSEIYKLTKIKVLSEIRFSGHDIQKGEFLSIKPLKEKLKSSVYKVKAAKDKKLPKIMLKIQGYKALGKAYNNNEYVDENLLSAGIYVTWDVFNKSNDAEIQKSKIEKLKNSLEIEKALVDLNAEIVKINESLKKIKNSLKLAKQNISLKEELLKSAKTAFMLNTMSVDEYLQYENDLATAKSDYYGLLVRLNSLLAQKAFIYGKNLKKVFK